MKTNLLKSFMVAAIMNLPLMLFAQITYDITAPTEDGFVSDPTIITTNNPYLWNEMKVGKSAVDGSGNTTSAIIPFRLPDRPDGELVTAASLKVYVSYGREWADTNIDLYGLPYKKEDGGTGREIFPADHYSGPFVTDHGTDVAIEDDYFTKNVALGELDTPRWEETSATGNTALVDYLNAQYDAGAEAGDWVFLRLSVDNPDMHGAHYFKVTGGDSDTPATLSVTISGATAIKKTVNESLSVYPNPAPNGNFNIQTSGMGGTLSIYSATGQLVKTQPVKARNTKVNVQAGLPKGLYIIKLTDGNVVKTSKLRIQ